MAAEFAAKIGVWKEGKLAFGCLDDAGFHPYKGIWRITISLPQFPLCRMGIINMMDKALPDY